MNLSIISKAIISTSALLLSYTTSCENINKKSDKPYDSYVVAKQYRANKIVEDRILVSEMKRMKGLVVSVFDGHGGDLCSEYAAANLMKFLDVRIEKNFRVHDSLLKITKFSLEEAFEDVENGFKAVFQKNIDNIDYQRVGSCALVAILNPDLIVVANAGDSEGVLLGGEKPLKTNTRLNAGEPFEQERLKKEFPQESDIYKCIKNTNYCYVKGRLQPTRSLGDFYLKNAEYNFTNLPVFTGPYITHKPVITHFPFMTLTAKTLVLATDGLWDELDENEMNRLTEKHHETPETANILMNGAIKKILERNKIKDFETLDSIQNRRNLHDDISIVAVDLMEFWKKYKTYSSGKYRGY